MVEKIISTMEGVQDKAIQKELRNRDHAELVGDAIKACKPTYNRILRGRFSTNNFWGSDVIAKIGETTIRVGHLKPKVDTERLLGHNLTEEIRLQYGMLINEEDKVLNGPDEIARGLKASNLAPSEVSGEILYGLAATYNKLPEEIIKRAQEVSAITIAQDGVMYLPSKGKMIKFALADHVGKPVTVKDYDRIKAVLANDAVRDFLVDPRVTSQAVMVREVNEGIFNISIPNGNSWDVKLKTQPSPDEKISQPQWFTRRQFDLEDGNKLEVVETPDESLVVPITTDGKIVLVKRFSPALGREITTVLSAANSAGASSEQTAAQALAKLGIATDTELAVTETGSINSWKYLTATSRSFVAQLPFSSSEIQQRIDFADPETRGYVVLSPEEFYENINTEYSVIDKSKAKSEILDLNLGKISDLRTAVAVQLAMAAQSSETDALFQGDPEILALLQRKLPIIGSRSIDQPQGKDWLPRIIRRGEETIAVSSDQAQAIAVIDNKQGGQSIVFSVEPMFAHGRYSLILPGGGIEQEEAGADAAARETQQETGYLIDPASVRQTTPRRYASSLYTNVSNTVYEGKVVGKGDKSGADESRDEQGNEFAIPVEQIGWYIRNGHITDASTIAGLLDWGRKHNVKIL